MAKPGELFGKPIINSFLPQNIEIIDPAHGEFEVFAVFRNQLSLVLFSKQVIIIQRNEYRHENSDYKSSDN